MRWQIATLLSCLLCSALAEADEAPSLKIMARSSVYNVGEKKGIYCEKNNILEQIDWVNPDGEVVSGRSGKNTRVYVERRSSEPNLVALIIHSTKLTDSGNWTCQAGDVKEQIEIVVGDKVVMDEDHEEVRAEEGSTKNLHCKAKGFPKPVVQWYKKGILIEEDSKVAVRHKGDTYTLEIKRLNYADAGEYMCKVTQKALSHYTNKIVNLIVIHQPVFVNPKNNEIVYELDRGSKWRTEEVFAVFNETKNLTCSALAVPEPRFAWFRRNGHQDVEIKDEELVSETTSDTSKSSTLILRMVTEADLGQYKCTASNDRGKISTIFDVSPGKKPNPPEKIAVIRSNSSYIVFNVTCGNCTLGEDTNAPLDANNLPVIAFLFQFAEYQQEYPADWDHGFDIPVDIVDPENTFFEVGPLSNQTKYHVRVSSVNLAGNSEWLTLDKFVETSSCLRIIANVFVIAITIMSIIYF